MRTIRALTPIAASFILMGGATAARGQEPGDLPEPPPASDEEIYQGTCGHLGTSCDRNPAVTLELLTRPVRAGKDVRVRFRATLTDAGRPVLGARVQLAGGTASTDSRGRAALVADLVRPGPYRARLNGDDVRPATVTVRVVERPS